jgi:hypothetical protein
MPLFPALGPQFYDEEDRPILSKMEAFYSQAISINESFWSEADTDTRFEAGDQTLWNDIYGNLPLNRRRNFNFNRIRRVINMIGGYQRRNRKSTTVVPIENGDQDTADQFTKLIMWNDQQEQVLETISEAFHGALVTGMNLLQVWMDFRSDPVSGNIRVDNCSYNSFLIDPFFRKKDLTDCNGIWKRSFLTKQQALSLLPDKEEELMGLAGIDSRDGKFQFMPESYNFSVYNLLSYDEYYYRDFRVAKMLVDAETGETQEWKSDNEDSLKEFLRMFPQITVIKEEIPTVKLAIVVQGKVMYNGPQPAGIDCYPFVPVLGYYTPDLPYFPWRIQGVVRGLRDAQYLYNRRRIIELDILESQINSGFKYKENALVNPEHIFLQGQGRGLALKEEAQMTDVEKIAPADVPPSMIQLSELLGQEIQEISGVNEELLGSADDDKAGILSMLRQGAGLTTLQRLFDQLDFSQKLLGKIRLQMIQNNFMPGKVARVLDADPASEFYNKSFGRYDAAIEEGFNTTTQKQLQFAQLLHLKEVGVQIPDAILVQAATIQNKQELIDVIEAQTQGQQQAQQAQAQVEQQLVSAQTRMADAKAIADEGLGIERMSRIEENKALVEERRAAAEKDRELGLLHLAKAIKELDQIDLGQLEKLLTLDKIVNEEKDNLQAQRERREAIRNQLDQLQQQHLEAQLQPNAMPQPAEGAAGLETLQ